MRQCQDHDQADQMLKPTAFDVVEKFDDGHCLMLSRLEWTVNAIRRTAGEEVL